MTIQFSKYQGTGNDFIMIDNRGGLLTLTPGQISLLCDRKFGIGSDGIILIEETGFADFYMNFFNPDGSQSFCGNGSRCAVKFAQSLKMAGISGEFTAIDMKHPYLSDGAEVKIRMKNVMEIEHVRNDCIIHTGSPHYITYLDDLDDLDIIVEGHKIRFSDRFKDEGINVNFVKEMDGELWMRTYERGVENETLSCGTGVTAAALSLAEKLPGIESVVVHTRGGDLKVLFKRTSTGEFEDVWLCGPAEFVFQGEIDID